jgi:hypothetical protein
MIHISQVLENCIVSLLRAGGVTVAVGIGLGYAGMWLNRSWLRSRPARLAGAMAGAAMVLGASHAGAAISRWLAGR